GYVSIDPCPSQTPITIQEQWDEMLATKGLTVIDVYQQWCGPCKAVVSLLRKIKNELGEDLLHFATAEADSMEALEKYRGRCEPTFLFFGGGQLVGVLRGANAPLLQRRVLEELAKEKLVMEQGGARRTVGRHTHTHTHTHTTTHTEVHTLWQPLNEPGSTYKSRLPYFEELVRFMSSGPSHILVLSRAGPGPANVVQAWLDFMGPTDVEEAKRDKPHSLRAWYGTRTPLNAVHGSTDRLQAGRELALLLPHFSLAGAGQEGRGERTLALLRPAAARDRRGELLSRVGAAGFRVALRRELTMTEDQVRLFYRHHADEEPYPALQISMTSGPALALVLVRDHAIQTWRALLGPADLTQARKEDPNCLRALFAVETEPLNQLHGSASADEAQREIDLLFPVQRTLALITPGALQQHREEILEDVRAAGFSVVREKEAVLSREEAEDWYKEQRGQPAFTPLLEVLCGGPCLLLVLTKENAVEEWMALMGPLDPVEARESAPGSLRARFSSDLIHTAVHGSSSEQHAEEHILRLLGDLSSDPGLSGPADPPGRPADPPPPPPPPPPEVMDIPM
uniref:Nucleoside diphosphate kinase B n=1 Tax=Gadus morhua TaxID=8049 RepID=A0A8C4ZD58_GADMO